MTRKTDGDPEFKAMRLVYDALTNLDVEAQKRVLEYVLRRLSLEMSEPRFERSGSTFSPADLVRENREPPENALSAAAAGTSEDEFEGISPVAQRWIRRNGLTTDQLSKLFTLGVDEIELIAKKVPGRSKKDKMRSVALFTGLASYLGSGAARVTYESLKEALSHYDVYDSGNFSRDIRDLGAELSGSKENGYTLTARGLAAAAELIKEMNEPKESLH